MKRKILGISLLLIHSFVVYVLPVFIHYLIDLGVSRLGNHTLHLFASIAALVIQATIVTYATWKKNNIFSKIINRFLK